MKVLGIETSCDETSVAVVENGKKIISLVTFSQVDIHKSFGGVVPEIASRNHLAKISDVLEEALKNLNLKDIDLISATNGPGLAGSLLVGTNIAKGLSITLRKPYTGVNHIFAHLYTPHIENDIPFPYIGLVASGGHTILFLVTSFYNIKFLGSTIDDALGEAFDKIAKFLNLGYPGGPIIDNLAKNGSPDILKEFKDITLPLSNERDKYNFSYSGLKTAFIYRIKKMQITQEILPHIAFAFQKIAIEHLLDKTLNAINDTNIKRLVISGGVSANSYLRKRLLDLKDQGIDVYQSSLELCSDNGAMVAGRAYIDYVKSPFEYSKEHLKNVIFSRFSEVKKGKRVS